MAVAQRQVVDRDVRRRTLDTYNKQRDNFPTLREYNDYLEEVEELIHLQLSRDFLDEQTRFRMEQYKAQNKEVIERNRERKKEQERDVRERINKDWAAWERHRIELKELQTKRERELIDFQEAQLSKIEAGEDLKTIQLTAPAPSAPTHLPVLIPTALTREFKPVLKPHELEKLEARKAGPPPVDHTILRDAHERMVRDRAASACLEALFPNLDSIL